MSAGTSGETIRFGRMDRKPIYDEPSEVMAGKDVVAVKGPDDVDVVMTPEAAEKTSDRLLEGALVARGKRLMEKLPHRPKR